MKFSKSFGTKLANDQNTFPMQYESLKRSEKLQRAILRGYTFGMLWYPARRRPGGVWYHFGIGARVGILVWYNFFCMDLV